MTRATALALCALLAACSPAASGEATPSPYVASAVGRIDSSGEARRLVAQTSGVIERILVSRGERVQAGQPLLTIACAPQQADVSASRALFAQAEAEAATIAGGARREEREAAAARARAAQVVVADALDRQRRLEALAQRGFAANRDLAAHANAVARARAEAAAADSTYALLRNGARASDVAAARARADGARAAWQRSKDLVDQCVLRSPVAGEVLQIFRREGEFSDAPDGTPLMVVGDTGDRIVRVEIHEADVLLVRPGQSADVWIDGQPRQWRGTVAELADLMGRRTARSLDPTDRFDRDVREVLVRFPAPAHAPSGPIGLRVMVGFRR